MDAETIVTNVLENNAESLKKLDSITKHRSVYDTLMNVAKERTYFLGIAGLRGIGKTILLLQLAKASGGVYFSADNRDLRGTDIYDIIKALSDAGHERIFIDEIHAKPDWDGDLKTAYDEGLAHVVFTGSSAMELKTLKADLSRRVVLERLKPASFREWLSIKKGIDLPLVGLEELIKNKAKLARDYASASKHLADYYRFGGVLYDAKTYFYRTIISTIETIATKDFAAIKEVESDTAENFFKLLYLVASSKPVELSYSKIGETLKKDKVWVMRFLFNVEKTEVIKRVYACGEGPKPVRKEAKYYLPFPYRASLCAALNKTPNIGSLREEFFVNHLECCYLKTSPAAPTADFEAEGLTFEVGGSGKKIGRQKADYVVTDSLDTSNGKLPLFAFGLLY